MIIVRANARNATYISDDLITSGSVGIPVTFNLSEDFDGLSCIAVFEGSGAAVDVALMGDSCVVPHEVVATAGGYLRIGIYASNSEGTIVIPTVWAGSKMILQGTEPSEVDPSAPTPSWVAQVQAAAAEALENSEEAIEIAGGAQAAADDARESASAAAGSATAAAQSESAASGYATSASGSASAAAQSATWAAGSASNAASSASAAAGSATAAAGSAAAAAASEAAAREVQESIPVDYTALSEDVSELKSQMGIPAEETPEFTEVRGKFIHKNRSITNTSGTFCITTPVEVCEGDSVSITGMGSVNISAITETDSDGNVIRIIKVYSADSVMETLEYTAEKHEYIVFSYNYSVTTTIKLQKAGTFYNSVLDLENAGNNYIEKFVNDIYKFNDGYYQYNTGNFITNTTLFRYKVIPVDPSKDKFLKYSYTIESSSTPVYVACFLTGVGTGALTGARLPYTTAGTFSGEIPVPENAASLVLSLRSTNYSWKFYLCKAHEGKSYDTIMDMASSGATGEARVGGYIFQNKAENPEILYQNQHGYNQSYYSANETAEQFKCISDPKPPILDGVFNQLESEEIDFTPTDSRYTRIVCGKDRDDNFFVSYESSNRNGTPGAEVNCKLEMTRDFVNFTPVMRGADNTSLPDIPFVAGAQHLRFLNVKQFSNGDYLIVASGQTANDTYATVYFRMSADRTSVVECEYTAFDGTIKPMEDEFAGGAYDWHVDVKGNRAIATTYGTRQPDTDYGRVWYTEDCGKTWKQVFQTNTHYQDGVDSDDPAVTQTHTHGVMLDPYANRMFVICGEDNRNIFWNDHGLDADNDNWNVIPIRNTMKGVSQIASFTQVVNGFAFDKSLIFGSDNPNLGCLYRINKLDGDAYSEIEIAHELLPNYFTGNTYYCGGEIFRRDLRTPMFFCMTRENNMPTEAQNELLNEMHKGRVIASYDGINFAEVWADNTYGAHSVYFDGAVTTKNFSYCTRGMNCFLLNNGDAVIKYAGRENYFFGGTGYPTGYSNGCCKVLWLKNAEQFV